MVDPRPDLIYDSKEWTNLLVMAEKLNPMLVGALHGFRCGGLRLHRGAQGYALRPEFDLNKSIWINQEDYKRDRDEWLLQWQKEIVELLKRLPT